jgi:hypothetical protein
MKSRNRRIEMADKYYVISSFENWSGDSGWGEEYFGPFESLEQAEAEAKQHECDCSDRAPEHGKAKHIVEIIHGSIGEGDALPGGVIIKRTSEKLYD